MRPIFIALIGALVTVLIMSVVAMTNPIFVSDVTFGKVNVVGGDSLHGRELFIERRCVACHSINEVGGTDAPDLAKIDHRHMDALDMAADMWNHAPIMVPLMKNEGVPWPVFGEDEMADLVAFLHDRKLQKEFNEGLIPEGMVHEEEEEGTGHAD
jgi:cytochrome c